MLNKIIFTIAGTVFLISGAFAADNQKFFSSIEWKKVTEQEIQIPKDIQSIPEISSMPSSPEERMKILEQKGLHFEYQTYPNVMKPQMATNAYIGFDKKNLYMAIKGEKSEKYKLQEYMPESETPKIWSDDNFEIFIDPFLSRNEFYQMIINPLGATYDSKCIEEMIADPKAANPSELIPRISADMNYSSGIKVKVLKENKSWTAIVEIPFSGFGLEAAPAGEAWGFNFCHSNRENKELSQWKVTPGNFLNPRNFGTLRFGEKKKSITASFSLPLAGYGENIIHLSTTTENAIKCSSKTSVKDTSGKTLEKNDKMLHLAKGSITTELKFKIPFDEKGKFSITSILQEGENTCGYFLKNIILTKPAVLAIPLKEIYSSDKEMKGSLRLFLGEAELAKVKLKISITGKNFSKNTVFDKVQGNALCFEIITEGLKSGDYELTVNLMSDGKLIASEKENFSVMEAPFAF